MAKKLSDQALRTALYVIIEEEWGVFLSNVCKSEANHHHDPMLDKDDLKQDILEYIFRYNFKAVKERSKDGEVWVPYLRNTVRNCFVNIRKSTKNWRIRLDMISSDIHDLQIDSSRAQMPHLTHSTNTGKEYEYRELISRVAEKLDKQERKLFLELINPSKKFTKFLRSKKKGAAEVFHSRKLVKEYFGLSYPRVLSMFKKFQQTIELCSSTL